MSAPFDLPRTGITTAAQTRERVGTCTVTTRRELLPRALYTACRWRDRDGRLECQRHSSAGPQWYEPTPALLAGWAREMGLGVDPSDPYAGSLMSAADVAEQVTVEVVELARAGLAPPSRTVETLSEARALALQLATGIELLTDGDRLFWRDRVADPVRGGSGRQLDPPDPAGGRASAGLLGWLRADPLDGAQEVTAALVEQTVQSRGYLGPYARRPEWTDVVRELRLLAGLGPEPGAEPGPGTAWLRRNRS